MGFHSLSIGASALLTARYGLDVTGQNLGNIDTPGYSRQRVNQSATNGWSTGFAALGNGVWVQSIRRIGDEYVEKQLRQATSTDTYYGNLQNCYTNIQSFFAELSGLNSDTAGHALSDSMNSFWDSMNDFSTHVENLSVRTTTINDAEGLVSRFNRIATQLTDYRRDINNEVAESVTQINKLLEQIGALNKSIVATELGGNSSICANDLRDQRGEAVKELYSYMDVDVVEEENGSYMVSMHGRNLVYYDLVKPLSVEKTLSADGTMVNTPVYASDRYPITPKDGQLAAQMEMRDVVITGYKNDIDSLAANFIWEFNRAYSQTRGLETFDSVTGSNGPIDATATLDKLQYNDNVPAGTFQIVNGNFEIVIQNRNTNEAQTVNIEVDLDGRLSPSGEPDTILWDPDNPTASNSLINRMQKALDEKAPGVFEVKIDQHNQVSITSKSSDYGFCFGEDTSGAVAALGLNVFFTGHNAGNMGVNQDLHTNPQHLGGAYSFNKGDSDGVMSLLKVRDQTVGVLQGQTLEGYYQSIAGRLGSEANQTTGMKKLSVDILNRMFTQRETLSGVNEDEEVTKMLTYQRAFQSAAKFISTMDQLYETLINM